MSSHDIVRVFKGVGLVVDHLVVMNKSGLRDKITRAQFHVNELMKVAYEIRSDMSSSESENSQSNYTSSPTGSKSSHDGSTSSYSSASPISVIPNPLAPTFVREGKEITPATSASAMPFLSPVAPTIHAVVQITPIVASAVVMPSIPIVAERLVSIPISIQDLNTVSRHHEIPLKKNEDPTDLIGFDPVIKGTNPSQTKHNGSRDSNSVVNGVRTSSMRERAVPATQLVRPSCFLEELFRQTSFY